jgi:hypothetical protein
MSISRIHGEQFKKMKSIQFDAKKHYLAQANKCTLVELALFLGLCTP